MKTIRSISVIIFAGLVSLSTPVITMVSGAETPAATVVVTTTAPASTAAPAVVATASAQTNYKDAFLAFALDKAKSYSGSIENVVSKGVDKAIEEGPVVCKEYLRWKACYHGFWALFCAVFITTSITLFIKHWPRFELDTSSSSRFFSKGSSFNLIATIIGAMGSFASIPIMINCGIPNLLSFIQILVAPRVYIIEQVLHLMGK